MALVVVDKENYVLDGVLYEIPLLDKPLGELSVERAVAFYKNRLVEPGQAFGKLDIPIAESKQDEMPHEEFVQFVRQDPVEVAKNLSIDEFFDEEEYVHPNEAAFQVLDIMYDADGRTIFGRIHLLLTQSGRYARAQVDAGMKCVISQAQIDEVVDNAARAQNGFSLKQIMRKIRGGWRVAFEYPDNTPKNENQH